MISILFATNFHFGIHVLTALVFFAIGWLHLDSWRASHKSHFILSLAMGYILISLALIGKAVQITHSTLLSVINVTHLIGLTLLATGLVTEPLLKPPSKSTGKKQIVTRTLVLSPLLMSWILLPAQLAASLIVTVLYLIRATSGYQKQLLLAGIGFAFISTAQLLELSVLFDTVSNPQLYRLFAEFGPVWYGQRIALAIGMLIMAAWTWSYLRFRFRSQLFLAMTGVVITIFLVTTSGFTWLLLRNLENTILDSLQTNIKVFQYSLEQNQLERLATNKSLAVNNKLIATTDRQELAEIANQLMIENGASFLHVLDAQGIVRVRAEDTERAGDSLANNAVIQDALAGEAQSAISIDNTLMVPNILITAATPILNEDSQVLGAVSSGYIIDNAFVDGIKTVTGLESTIFAGSQRVATTLVAEDGANRYLMTQESNLDIIEQVLNEGGYYLGSNDALNIPYYVAYAPIKDTQQNTIGMLAVGELQTSLEELTRESIRSTFAVSVTLILLAIGPIYLFSKKIEENITA